MPESTIHIGFPIFPDFTLLDLAGPLDVLAKLPGAVCHLIAHDPQPVMANGGSTMLPTTTFAECPRLDVLCVPGGPGHLRAMEDADLLAFLKRHAAGCRFVTSVCTGAMVLAAAGLLDGYLATTHWLSLPRLAAFGAEPVRHRVVVDRNRITGGGVTAGIDFGLLLATRLAGGRIARMIQLQIEYAPSPPFADGDPDRAEPAILAAVKEANVAYLERASAVDRRVMGT